MKKPYLEWMWKPTLGFATLILLSFSLVGGCGDAKKNTKSVASNAGTDADDADDDGKDAGGEKPGKSGSIDRSHLADTGTKPLDYADPALWVCRPGNDPNECLRDIDATEIRSDGSREVLPHKRAEDPEVDCFYVYPTVALTGSGNMTDFSDISAVLDPLLSQAVRFTRICEVYAPLYRQVVLNSSGGMITTTGDRELPVNDVKAAFKYYLEHLSKGRKFVLMGHSQGTTMLKALIASEIDNDPELRARMVSALLIGSSVDVPEGEVVGGVFKNIPGCTKPGQTGCVISYATFDAAAPPGASSVFGRAAAGNQALCTNPRLLSGERDPNTYRGSYFPMKLGNPTFAPDQPKPEGVTTPFVLYRDLFVGDCVKREEFSHLEAHIVEGDPRAPPYRSALLEGIGFGLHLVDYNIALEDLIEATSLQIEASR